jgi:hypothetical protein
MNIFELNRYAIIDKRVIDYITTVKDYNLLKEIIKIDLNAIIENSRHYNVYTHNKWHQDSKLPLWLKTCDEEKFKSFCDGFNMNCGYWGSPNFWKCLSMNPNFTDFLEKKYPDKIDWELLSFNENAIHLIEKKLEGSSLTDKSNVETRFLNEKPSEISWKYLSSNANAIHLLENNLDKIDWEFLSLNRNAIHLIKKNLDKINWNILCLNPNAIDLLENNIEKIDWTNLSLNQNARDLLLKNINKINWKNVLSNRYFDYGNTTWLITFDYDKIKRDKEELNEEFMSWYWSPDRINYWKWEKTSDFN